MRVLNEQWIEVIDGQEHMVKCIKVTRNPFPVEDRFSDGYFFTNNKITDGEYSYYEIIKAKDLGILKDGCLPCPFCGEYPNIRYAETHVCCSLISCHTHCWSHIAEATSVNTLQEAIDAWNRRD